MGYTTIGSLIEQGRKERGGMTREQLANGICSPQMLYMIEKDQSESDILLTDMLLQRLGKSPDKLERILKSEMYRMIRIRNLLEKAILKHKKVLAEYILANYPARTNVDKMYRYRMKASIYYHIDKDYDKALENLKLAVNMTLPDFTYDAVENYLISTIEMENLLALEKVKIEQNQEDINWKSEQHLEICMKYINNYFTDDEEYAKIYAKCAWLNACICYNKKKYIQAMAISEKGIEVLRKNTMIYFIQPLFNIMIQSETRIGALPERSKWVQYNNTLSFLWKSFAEEWYPTDSLFHNCYQTEYHLDYERIRDERKANGIIQEEFADGIYQDAGSLSRFENGKMSPNKKNFEKMMVKLGLEKGRYNGYVVTDSFDVMELRRRMDIQLMQCRYLEARETLEELKKYLDLKIGENKFVVEFHEILISYRIGNISAQTALEKVEGFLEGIFSHIPTRNEVLVINQYCILLSELGQAAKAERILEYSLRRMRDSKVHIEYRYRSYALLLNNYVRRHRNWNRVVEVLKFELFCGKASVIPFCLNNVLKVLEKEGVVDRELDQWSKAIYYMSDLYYFDREKEIYKIYLQNEKK